MEEVVYDKAWSVKKIGLIQETCRVLCSPSAWCPSWGWDQSKIMTQCLSIEKLLMILCSSLSKHLILIWVCVSFYSEKAMAPHSSTLAWKIPWTEEPGRLQSMGSLRVGHDWATSLSLFTFMHWRRKWQPTPVLLPGESQGQGSLVGCRLWGRIQSDTTEVT